MSFFKRKNNKTGIRDPYDPKEYDIPEEILDNYNVSIEIDDSDVELTDFSPFIILAIVCLITCGIVLYFDLFVPYTIAVFVVFIAASVASALMAMI